MTPSTPQNRLITPLLRTASRTMTALGDRLTGVRRDGRRRRRAYLHVQALAIAAARQSEAAGRAVTTLDDLLVAHAVIGGPAGQVLARHGVTAAGLRRAVAARDAADLAALGIALPEPTVEDAVRVAGWRGPVRDLELTPEARDALLGLPAEEAAGLADLMDHPSGRPVRALVKAGADVGLMRRDLLAVPAAEDAHSYSAPGRLDPTLLEAMGEPARISVRTARRFLPVEAAWLARTVADGREMAPLLVPLDESAAGRGGAESSRRGADPVQDLEAVEDRIAWTCRGTAFEYRRMLVQGGEGAASSDQVCEVAWLQGWPGRVEGRPGCTVLRVEPAEAGAVVSVTTAVAGIGRLAVLGRWVSGALSGFRAVQLFRALVEASAPSTPTPAEK